MVVKEKAIFGLEICLEQLRTIEKQLGLICIMIYGRDNEIPDEIKEEIRKLIRKYDESVQLIVSRWNGLKGSVGIE